MSMYQAGDMVRIKKEPWSMRAGDVVILTKVIENDGSTRYDFIIPEARGSVPEFMIERRCAAGFTQYAEDER